MRKLLITPTLLAGFLTVSCSIHQLEIQQGTVITVEHVGQLKLGMPQEEVQRVLGTPPITDPFHKNRWDYVYTLSRPHEDLEEKQITVFFENDKLVRMLTDIAPATDTAATITN